jgi:hypothetical protein
MFRAVRASSEHNIRNVGPTFATSPYGPNTFPLGPRNGTLRYKVTLFRQLDASREGPFPPIRSVSHLVAS